MKYKFISDTVVARIDDDGISRLSCSIEDATYQAWLAEGNTPEAADPMPNPRIAEIKAELAANDAKIIRALAEGDTTRIAVHNAEQEALRQELRALG